ncbi:hypothetical protein Q31b_10340 [Novipirellula aureliae]|uniref:Uncharacterized protein n=1 Tax=Novipirellula aureliae TaxID=2527966 RepID=A0A5C6EAH2_9BACT|nr:hypothetical protein Q31b_10340 [Novipirellula aureliae]
MQRLGSMKKNLFSGTGMEMLIGLGTGLDEETLAMKRMDDWGGRIEKFKMRNGL